MLNLKNVFKTAFIKITAKLKDIRISFSSLRWNFFFFLNQNILNTYVIETLFSLLRNLLNICNF